jgi:hypothetical protein
MRLYAHLRHFDQGSGRSLWMTHADTGLAWRVALAAGGQQSHPVVRCRGRTMSGDHRAAWCGLECCAHRRWLCAVSGEHDGTLRVWDTDTGVLLHTLRANRPYERMDITGLGGITEAQRASLKVLGAVEQRAAHPPHFASPPTIYSEASTFRPCALASIVESSRRWTGLI